MSALCQEQVRVIWQVQWSNPKTTKFTATRAQGSHDYVGNEEEVQWDRWGRHNARGYEQVDGSHYASDSIATPVTNPITVWLILTLFCMNPSWTSAIIDVEGTCLQGRFKNGEILYIEVLEGFGEWYPRNAVLRMNVPYYGTKQVAYCIFKTFAKPVKNMTYKYKQSKTDQSLYFA